MDPQLLRMIVEGTAGHIGSEFFEVLVQRLAEAAGTRYAWVTEWDESEKKLHALAFWNGSGFVRDYSYPVANTPCGVVIESSDLVHFPDKLLELFPDDPDLPPLEGVSYLGLALVDTDGRLLGHLALMHDGPLEKTDDLVAVFRIFAGRAGAELGRLRRERDLAEREQRFSLLIEHAMDAVIELDGQLDIRRVNPAAARLLGVQPETIAGEPVGPHLTEEARGRLDYFVRDIARRPEGARSVWITGGLTLVQDIRGEVPVEATLSRFDMDGDVQHTLILRDTAELQAAEEEIRSLLNTTKYLQSEIEALRGTVEILGESPTLLRVLADIERVASRETTVLVTGETGTGKELVVSAIHRRSPRAKGPLIRVNCAAIASNLQESEFFGHEKGAFTGADRAREGRFLLADGGTLFLDEVGEMSLDLQAKLLRVLQEGEFEPVGGTRTISIDVRVVAATNRDLETMVSEGTFRRDLLYRLNVFPIELPPLRERGDDVIILAEAFLQQLMDRTGRRGFRLTEDCRAKLRRYDWPGNVRELENVIERAFITTVDDRRLNLERALPESDTARAKPLAAPDGVATAPEEHILTATELRDLERANLLRALEACAWKISGPEGAAERLGIPANTFASRMKAAGIRRPRG